MTTAKTVTTKVFCFSTVTSADKNGVVVDHVVGCGSRRHCDDNGNDDVTTLRAVKSLSTRTVLFLTRSSVDNDDDDNDSISTTSSADNDVTSTTSSTTTMMIVT